MDNSFSTVLTIFLNKCKKKTVFSHILSFSVIATSSLDSYVRVWELQSGEKKQTIEAGPVDVWSVMFTPDSKHLISGSHAGKINWYNVETGKLHQSYDTRGKFTLSIACVSTINQLI